MTAPSTHPGARPAGADPTSASRQVPAQASASGYDVGIERRLFEFVRAGGTPVQSGQRSVRGSRPSPIPFPTLSVACDPQPEGPRACWVRGSLMGSGPQMSASGHFECARNLGGAAGASQAPGRGGRKPNMFAEVGVQTACRQGLGEGWRKLGQSAPSPGPPGAAKGLSLWPPPFPQDRFRGEHRGPAEKARGWSSGGSKPTWRPEGPLAADAPSPRPPCPAPTSSCRIRRPGELGSHVPRLQWQVFLSTCTALPCPPPPGPWGQPPSPSHPRPKNHCPETQDAAGPAPVHCHHCRHSERADRGQEGPPEPLGPGHQPLKST